MRTGFDKKHSELNSKNWTKDWTWLNSGQNNFDIPETIVSTTDKYPAWKFDLSFEI